MRTVPETAGVRIRLKIEIRKENRNWNKAAANIRQKSSAGPPAARASTLTAMAAAVVPETRK